MKIQKRTFLNVLLILFVASFFVTPLGYYGKVFLMGLFAPSPDLIEPEEQRRIEDYQWRLKDEAWDIFNFNRSEGKVVFINFWASWHLPSDAELKDLQKIYDQYKDKIDFYFITNEEQEPVREYMEKHDFTFPVTYLIIGDPAPLEIKKPSASYVIDKDGKIVIQQEGVANWNSSKFKEFLEELIAP